MITCSLTPFRTAKPRAIDRSPSRNPLYQLTAGSHLEINRTRYSNLYISESDPLLSILAWDFLLAMRCGTTTFHERCLAHGARAVPGLGDFFDFHVAQYSTAACLLAETAYLLTRGVVHPNMLHILGAGRGLEIFWTPARRIRIDKGAINTGA
jgi:hypothetical protein